MMPQFWSDIQNNGYNRTNNAYNSLCSAVDLHLKPVWRSWTLISQRSAHRTRIGVCQLLQMIGMQTVTVPQQKPKIIKNNRKNNQNNGAIIV
jgi:hypothetical protein